MTLGRGDPTVFLTRPISLTLILLTVAVLLVVLLPQVRRKRAEVFVEED
jgi:TctA family transporter